jgi:hypothetical protein
VGNNSALLAAGGDRRVSEALTVGCNISPTFSNFDENPERTDSKGMPNSLMFLGIRVVMHWHVLP